MGEHDGSRSGKKERYTLIVLVFALTALAVASSTVLTFYFGNRVLAAHARESVRRQAVNDLNQLQSTLVDAETGQRGFIISGDKDYLRPYDAAVDRLPPLLAQLKSSPEKKLDSADLARLTQLSEEKLAELRQTIDLRETQGFDAAAAVVRENAGRVKMEEFRATIEKMKAAQLAILQRDSWESDATTRTRTAVFIVTGLLNIFFLLWAYRLISRTLKQRDSALATAREREREIHEQKDLLAVTLASIGDCVIVTDGEGQITFMNAVAESVTGWTFIDARGRPNSEIFRILSEETRAPAANPVDRVLREGVIVGLANHTLLVRKDGTEVPIDDSGAPIKDEAGKLRGVVLVFRDFSDHRRAQRELQAAKDEAETANKAKDRFLAMLSHELRTPLTPVLATLNLWEGNDRLPAELAEDVKMLRRSVELEARIIDDLLDLTRISRGMLSLAPENTDVHAVLTFLCDLSRSDLQGRSLSVTLDLKAERHHIHADTARLQQVFWNVLRNAIKFTDEKGQIRIASRNNDDGRIEIAISDTGIGMTRETISRLFQPFEQADHARSSRYGGLGLGMAISSALVELLDGELTAESDGIGRGSTFLVQFPTVEAQEQKTEIITPRPVTERLRVLLIEDHADTANALTKLLRSRNYEVRAETSVAAALAAAKEDHFDVYLCDLGLPDGTGLDFVAGAQKINSTPAIALTGFGMQQDIERALSAGFAAHLTKPLNLQKLEAEIHRLLTKNG